MRMLWVIPNVYACHDDEGVLFHVRSLLSKGLVGDPSSLALFPVRRLVDEDPPYPVLQDRAEELLPDGSGAAIISCGPCTTLTVLACP